MRVLFFTHPLPNYQPDLLLHGLRTLLGPQVTDYPRKDCLYKGALGLAVSDDDQLCPGWFPQEDQPIDRSDIVKKLQQQYFDLVVTDLRALVDSHQTILQAGNKLVIVDGEDRPLTKRVGPFPIFSRETDGKSQN